MRSRIGVAFKSFRRGEHPLARFGALCSLAGVVIIAAASPASGSVTLGELAPTNSQSDYCPGAGTSFIQPTVVSHNPYVAPGAGTITSWRIFASVVGGTGAQ
jgi:hypothetical protein